MFTGIIEEVGTATNSDPGVLCVEAPRIVEDAQPGDSIAVNGVDLTVADLRDGCFFVNVMPETYRRSNLADLVVGSRVNLERSLRPTDRLSGHIVRGVVEGTGTLEDLRPEGEALIATYAAPRELLSYIVMKGPVCVDGASLTVMAKTDATFSVSLVQYTQEHTNLTQRARGARVNLETDIIARYVGQWLEERGLGQLS